MRPNMWLKVEVSSGMFPSERTAAPCGRPPWYKPRTAERRWRLSIVGASLLFRKTRCSISGLEST